MNGDTLSGRWCQFCEYRAWLRWLLTVGFNGEWPQTYIGEGNRAK